MENKDLRVFKDSDGSYIIAESEVIAKAVKAERARLREAVEGMKNDHFDTGSTSVSYNLGYTDALDDVLQLLTDEEGKGTEEK